MGNKASASSSSRIADELPEEREADHLHDREDDALIEEDKEMAQQEPEIIDLGQAEQEAEATVGEEGDLGGAPVVGAPVQPIQVVMPTPPGGEAPRSAQDPEIMGQAEEEAEAPAREEGEVEGAPAVEAIGNKASASSSSGIANELPEERKADHHGHEDNALIEEDTEMAQQEPGIMIGQAEEAAEATAREEGALGGVPDLWTDEDPEIMGQAEEEAEGQAEEEAEEPAREEGELGGAPAVEAPVLPVRVVWPMQQGFGAPRSELEEQALHEIRLLPPIQPSGRTFLRIFEGSKNRGQPLPGSFRNELAPLAGQFIGIRCLSGTIYMVRVVEEDGEMVLEEGWSTLARGERLRNNHVGQFSRISDRHFDLIVYYRSNGVERSLVVVDPCIGEEQEEVSWDTIAHVEAENVDEMTPEIRNRVTKIWSSSIDKFTVYTAKVTKGQITGRFFHFSREYSDLLPNQDTNLHMKFRGSNHVTIATLTKVNGICYIRDAWGKFADEHRVIAGKTYIFRFRFVSGGVASLMVTSA
ncbi:hypothetical protein EJB05_08613 [Eragrostis curvula]|uniref:TF-B3 domain-containing protein n=1 Tax=Eragrostis curvula TaxID=38414 RepID=A0A5J9W4I5_9POAL|nr:hypothetical protein EJB05_08613 [Eragrostis curvula]